MIINYERFLDEIERYNWQNRRDHPNKIIASSPFGLRPDSNPSFFVNLDPSSENFGAWADRGATNPEWKSGGPIRLYAWLRDLTYEEAQSELYGDSDLTGEAPKELRIKLGSISAARARPAEIDLSAYNETEVSYLTGRRITPAVQRLFSCRYDSDKGAVVMPWCDPSGRILNAKWRATWSKAFWYAKNAAPIRDMVYGINVIYDHNAERVLIVESETDAMYSWSCGVPAVAIGGSAFTEAKADLIRRSPIRSLIIGTDNDAAGEAVRSEIEKRMRGYVELAHVRWPDGIKDANDVEDPAELRTLIDATPNIRSFKCARLIRG